MNTPRLAVSKGYKLNEKGTALVNKYGTVNPKFWRVKKPTFSLVKTPSSVNRALFKCKQTGELIILKHKIREVGDLT